MNGYTLLNFIPSPFYLDGGFWVIRPGGGKGGEENDQPTRPFIFLLAIFLPPLSNSSSPLGTLPPSIKKICLYSHPPNPNPTHTHTTLTNHKYSRPEGIPKAFQNPTPQQVGGAAIELIFVGYFEVGWRFTSFSPFPQSQRLPRLITPPPPLPSPFSLLPSPFPLPSPQLR